MGASGVTVHPETHPCTPALPTSVPTPSPTAPTHAQARCLEQLCPCPSPGPMNTLSGGTFVVPGSAGDLLQYLAVPGGTLPLTKCALHSETLLRSGTTQ